MFGWRSVVEFSSIGLDEDFGCRRDEFALVVDTFDFGDELRLIRARFWQIIWSSVGNYGTDCQKCGENWDFLGNLHGSCWLGQVSIMGRGSGNKRGPLLVMLTFD